MMFKVSRTLAVSFLISTSFLFAQTPAAAKPKPRVVVIGVNGMEMDVLRPLILQGKMPNLSSVIKRGAYGKLRTVSAPNCPRVYSTLFTSTTPEEHGVTGFIVGGVTANTNMLKEEPIWSILSKNHSHRRHGKCTCNVSRDAGEWLYGQRHAHPRQELRGWRVVRSKAV